jgi:ATP-binding cassette subfamily C protein LapB
MDETTERLFIRRFAVWCRGKTVVIATHRMRVLDLIDRIVALDQGRVVVDAPKEEALRLLRGEPGTYPPESALGQRQKLEQAFEQHPSHGSGTP